MNKIVFKKGESVTIGFLLNSEYDMSRIQSASAWVGGKKITLATIDHILRCELASDETHKLSGNYKLILWIDDSTLGVKKIHAADIEISTNNSNDNNDSINEGYDFVFNITINETAIQAGDVLYNYVKGDNANLPDGIVIDPNYVHTDNNYNDAAVTEVAKIAGKQDKTDNLLATDDKTVVGAINEVNSVAKGANQALAFDNYQAVIAAMLISGLNEGQNLYVDTLDVPDLWVKSVELTSTAYTYTTDEQFVTDILAGVQIGYYKLALLETQKVDLTNYYNKGEVDNLLDDKSDVGHNHSGETINPEAIDFDLTPTTDPNIQGRMQYSPTERTIEFGVEGGTIDVNKELFDYYVDTNNDLVEGNVVSVTGISGNRQAVTKTNHTLRASATACIGMVTHKNADNTVRVTKKGRVRKLNTGGMTEGLPVYANATGGFTQTEPSPGDYFIHVGIVEVAHAVNGVIDVDIRIVYDVEDLSNVDGAATTVASGDSFFLKVGNLWKTITESNFLSWFRGLSHTWSLIQDFAAGLKTDIITKRNGSGLYKLQDGGTEWHTAKWFTPTGTFTSVGTAVTTTGGQLTSAMIGAKIGVGEDKRIIAAFINSNQCTVDSAFSQDYSGVVSGSWGVYKYLDSYDNINVIKTFYSHTGSSVRLMQASYTSSKSGVGETANLSGDALDIGSNTSIRASSTTGWYSTKDTGLRRAAAGLWEIFDGITNGTLRDLKLRSLYGDRIIPNSDTTGVVIRNAADSADVVNVDTGGILLNPGYKFYFRNKNTYIESPANGKYSFYSNNVEILTIDNNNTIYIGAVNGLHISPGGDLEILKSDFTDNFFRFKRINNQETRLTLGSGNNFTILGGSLGLETSLPESKLDINGTTTHRDWTYFNNGTHTGDAVGDIRMKNISGVLTFYRCTVGNTTKGSGTWEQIHTIG